MTAIALRISRGIFSILLCTSSLAADGSGAMPSMANHAPAGLEIAMVPNGAVADAGWALARLNDGTCTTNKSFAYPETTTPVRLYLIDTGVAHAGTWFAQNPKLMSFHSELVRGEGDPTTSEAVRHGSQMLSLIAGPETGAAIGTPIHVVNYNVYPGLENGTTTSGRIIEAIYRAMDHQSDHPEIRGVICIANGSSFPGAVSHQLEFVISEAVNAGIPVIVSAGNEGADSASYLPAAYGTREGVVCVGASGLDNEKLALSNGGDAVDLYAPGHEVRTMNVANPQSCSYEKATGTSPAAALTAAAALIQLSLDSTLTPAALEERLVSAATPTVPAGSSQELLVQVQPDPEGDSDLDGTSDILERFFGSNPADRAARPQPMSLIRVSGQGRLSFTLAEALFDPAQPYVLADGSAWKVKRSANLKDWQDASGTLAPGAAVGGLVPVTFTIPDAGASCFLRIEVTPAP